MHAYLREHHTHIYNNTFCGLCEVLSYNLVDDTVASKVGKP